MRRFIANFFVTILLISSALISSSAFSSQVLKVGPGQEFVLPSIAAQFAMKGDVIEIDASGEYLNDFVIWKQDNLIIRGVNGRPHIISTINSPNKKAIWVVKGDGISISNVEMSGAKVKHKNGAAIRLAGKNFTLSDCYIHDNQNGILSGKNKKSEVLIDDCEFAFNGYGKGQTHNIYIGKVDRLTIKNSYIHNANIGHNIKSRAKENYILYNRIFEGKSSYAIDISNGGYSLIMGNIIYQGDLTENSAMIALGMEGGRVNSRLEFVFNSVLNERNAGSFIKSKGKIEALIANNIFDGRGRVLDGGLNYRDNYYGMGVFEEFSAREVTVKKELFHYVVDKGVKVNAELVPGFHAQENSLQKRIEKGKAFDMGAIEYN